MGYNIHITRKEKWFYEEPINDISLEEWKEYIHSDSELRLDNFAEIISPNGETIRIEREGISVWNNHSKKIPVWISWHNKKISVSNPDEEIIKKMLKIAKSFNAKVQGDEGEDYEEDSNGNIVSN